MFKLWRGEPRVSACQRHNEIHHTKGRMANIMLWPCGLGCYMLGLHSTTCLGTNLVRNYLL